LGGQSAVIASPLGAMEAVWGSNLSMVLPSGHQSAGEPSPVNDQARWSERPTGLSAHHGYRTIRNDLIFQHSLCTPSVASPGPDAAPEGPPRQVNHRRDEFQPSTLLCSGGLSAGASSDLIYCHFGAALFLIKMPS
jgi:hypothetical protein